MKSLACAALFQFVGLLGQWLGYCKGLPFLIVFWWLLMAVVYLSDIPRWSQLLQTGIQTATLIILLLFSFNILTWA
ncbi:MAG TPA: hypothetical protein VMC85_15455 [Desulfomonilaceae bacterium]|nr:hypothetical protein [Desulfomonilaceae bacterium]